jgi:HlyD family secretion protein
VEEQRVNVVLDILSPVEQRQTLGDRFRVDVRIPVQVTDGALIAPIGAIFPYGSKQALFMVHAGRAVLQEVDVVARNGRQAWVRDELQRGPQSGTDVIVYPPPSLKHGDRIKPTQRQGKSG